MQFFFWGGWGSPSLPYSASKCIVNEEHLAHIATVRRCQYQEPKKIHTIIPSSCGAKVF